MIPVRLRSHLRLVLFFARGRPTSFVEEVWANNSDESRCNAGLARPTEFTMGATIAFISVRTQIHQSCMRSTNMSYLLSVLLHVYSIHFISTPEIQDRKQDAPPPCLLLLFKEKYYLSGGVDMHRIW